MYPQECHNVEEVAADTMNLLAETATTVAIDLTVAFTPGGEEMAKGAAILWHECDDGSTDNNNSAPLCCSYCAIQSYIWIR